MTERRDIFTSLAQAGFYAKVTRQAILRAIKKGQLKAFKHPASKSWIIQRKDLDSYRSSRYLCDKRMVQGQKVFDIAEDRWSVLHVSKTLSKMLGYPILASHIYYLLRTGQIQGKKNGASWIISKEEMMNLRDKHLKKQKAL